MSPESPSQDVPQTPEQHAASAHEAISRGDRAHAAHHLGMALAGVPQHPKWRTLLDELISQTPDPLTLAPLVERTHFSVVALRAYILAKLGRVEEAIPILSQLTQAKPDVPYMLWSLDWLEVKEAATSLDPKTLQMFGATWLNLFPGDVVPDEGLRKLLARVSAILEGQQERLVADANFLTLRATLLRKHGELDLALRTALESSERFPGYGSAVCLSMVHRSRGEARDAEHQLNLALEFKSDDLAARLDLADLLCQIGRTGEAETIYDKVIAQHPEHPVALPTSYFLRYSRTSDFPWLRRLHEYARVHPDNPVAQELRDRSTPYVGFMPDPADVIVTTLRGVIAKMADEVPPAGVNAAPPPQEVRITVNGPEAASNRLACDMEMARAGRSLQVMLNVQSIPTPDPREPVGPVEYRLWTYEDQSPRPAVPAPTRATMEAVCPLAVQPYDLRYWRMAADQIAPTLGDDAPAQLLGLMANPPLAPDDIPAWRWIQSVQFASALVLAAREPGWEGSKRRTILLDLANGPLDWSVTAAVATLAQIALEVPEAKTDVVPLFKAMRERTWRKTYVCWDVALRFAWLRLPDQDDVVRELLWTDLQTLHDDAEKALHADDETDSEDDEIARNDRESSDEREASGPSGPSLLSRIAGGIKGLFGK